MLEILCMQNGTVEIVSADGLTVYKQLAEVSAHPSLPHPLRIRSAAQRSDRRCGLVGLWFEALF